MVSASSSKTVSMIAKGRRFAKFLPAGYFLLGIDPGYLFSGHRKMPIDLTEEAVETLLRHLEKEANK